MAKQTLSAAEKSAIRSFRSVVRRAALDLNERGEPGPFARACLAVWQTSSGGRVVESGLVNEDSESARADAVRVQSFLMRVARAVQGEVGK